MRNQAVGRGQGLGKGGLRLTMGELRQPKQLKSRRPDLRPTKSAQIMYMDQGVGLGAPPQYSKLGVG